MKPFTKRQMCVIELIANKKSANADALTLDEIMDHLSENGYSPSRQSMIVCMKMLVARLQADGIRIKQKPAIGRGRRMEFELQ